ncbi:hypothetical protein ABI_16690 [Asticcacaulis biprosthecium C19]|uniref:Uncharacterized protein n=1 Tax=Asticcacaulis biprosthecium C19 TaxID=715226 RepID=F4QJX2_9CAUL|nr:hypothetical protein [Asticcacaulis biprosthecium]EGF93229.1 hypothetical protein ABI_16690 [Asticcacaulis biprosthecium C19]
MTDNDLARRVEDLKASGHSIVDTIRCLVEIHGLTLKDAKALVHHSPAWAGERIAHEAFHAELISILKSET